MRILIDESLPRHIKQFLKLHEVATVQELGWAGIKNGELVARADMTFDVFMTADKNLRYQQNIARRTLALIVFPSNKLSVVRRLRSQIDEALKAAQAGNYIELEMPD